MKRAKSGNLLSRAYMISLMTNLLQTVQGNWIDCLATYGKAKKFKIRLSKIISSKIAMSISRSRRGSKP
jgi:hypothetical protein